MSEPEEVQPNEEVAPAVAQEMEQQQEVAPVSQEEEETQPNAPEEETQPTPTSPDESKYEDAPANAEVESVAVDVAAAAADAPVATPAPEEEATPAVPAVVVPLGPDPSTVFLPLQLHTINTTYVAKLNHFLQSDPIVVVAVDNRPMMKTTIRPNSTDSTWDLSNPEDVQAVPGGIALPPAASFPTILLPVSELSTSRLQVHQEDFSRLKCSDEMGGFTIPLEEIVTRSWKKDVKKAGVPATPRGRAPSADQAIVSPTPAAPLEDGWYPVSIDNASLLDRVTGRHLGDVSLTLSVRLDDYLQYLVASQTGLHLIYELTQQFLARPTADTPLRHVLLDPASLKALIAFVVKAGADKGSMDGERMRERIFSLIGKALDVFKPDNQILDSLFANDSEVWALLFQLHRCIPLSTLASAPSFQSYEQLIQSFVALVERVALELEPPPPPPVKSEEEVAAEAAAEAAAAKRAALKEKKRRAAAVAAGLDPDEAVSEPSTSRKKKSGLLSGSSLPDPPIHPPSELFFGLHTLDVLHELFDAFRVRLTGFRKAGDVDFASEAKVADLVKSADFLYRFQPFLFRFGSISQITNEETNDATTVAPDADAAAAAAAAAASPASTAPRRVGSTEVRSLFLKETGDANALWFQKQLVAAVKKTKETLAENKELSVKLQQHSEYFTRLYPVDKAAKAEKEKKK